jgi:hypothetical protein
MAVSTAFLNTCETAVLALPEYAAYQAGVAAFESATDDAKLAKWQLLFGENQPGGSLALRLRRAVRDVVQANSTSSIPPGDLEAAYRQLAAPFATRYLDRPLTPAEEDAARVPLVTAVLLDG